METKIVKSTEEFYQLKEQWERLQEQDPDVTYYSTYEFVRTWWDVYNDPAKNSLFIICVYSGNNLVGIAPLMLQNENKFMFKYKVLKFLGRGDYFNFILDRTSGLELKSIRTIIEEIFSSKQWERIRLTHISSSSPLAYSLLSHRDYNNAFQYLVECPIIDITKYDSFEQYKKIYGIDKECKRYISKLQNEVGYKFYVVKNDEFEAYQIISQLHKAEQEYLIESKGRDERSSLFNKKEYSQFVENIYSGNEKVITFILEDNVSNLLSYYTCYFYKGVLHCWNTAYNPQYAKYKLNLILNYETFNYIFDNELAEKFDFGAGRYPWKFKWTKDFIFDYELYMWNTNTRKSRFLKFLYALKNKK